MRKLKLLFIVTLSFLLMIGCRKTPDKIMHIGCTIVPIQSFIINAVGEEQNLFCYQTIDATLALTELDVSTKKQLDQLDIYFTLGLPIEKNLILPYIQNNSSIRIIDLSTVSELNDTYFWLSPKKALLIYQQIQKSLVETYPNYIEQIMEDSSLYYEELTKLDTYLEVKYSSALERGLYDKSELLTTYCTDYKLESQLLDLTQPLTTYITNHSIQEYYQMNTQLVDDFIVIEPSENDFNVINFNPYASDYILNIKTLTDTIYSHLLD